jgi:hypothetical protein
MFYVLASDSEGEGEGVTERKERVEEIKPTVLKEEHFRVWKDDTRFKNEDTTIIFKSPFSKKNSAWLKPRFKEEDEWVSIETPESKDLEVTASSALPDPPSDTIPDTETPVQKFPSLLTRGVSEDKDRSTALAWAEKIKKSFDRADKTRFEFKKQPDPFVEKLSFFRRATLE